ncbi:MAG: RNA polymerase sigma factor [Ramlibacter sp.]
MMSVTNPIAPSANSVAFRSMSRQRPQRSGLLPGSRFPKTSTETSHEVDAQIEVEVDQEELFKELVTKYKTSLHYFVLKRIGHSDDAAEITQQAFASAASAVASYRGDAEISTWIFGIANNLTKNHVSRSPQRRFIHVSDDALEGCESPFADPCLQASQRESLELASHAMASLPDEMAEALNLVAVDGLSYKEAAQELDIPIGTVRSRVSRAREAVREYFRAAGAKDGF